MKDSTAKASVVDEILEFNRDREPKLVRRKFRRMTKDPFAFFRGTDQLFATHWPRPTWRPRCSSAATYTWRITAPTGPTRVRPVS